MILSLGFPYRVTKSCCPRTKHDERVTKHDDRVVRMLCWMMHVNLAVACVALWTTPISASSSLLPLTDNNVHSTKRCPPQDWSTTVSSTKSLQDGPFSIYLDGKELLSSTTREPHRMYSGARHILKLTVPNGGLRNENLHSLNGVLLEFGGGTLLSDAVRSDLMLYVDDEPPGIQIGEQCMTTSPQKDYTAAHYLPPSSQRQMGISWSLIVPYHIEGFWFNVTVASQNDANNKVEHYQSSFLLDVGVPPKSSWHTKMWEILLGLGTIGVAIKFVLVKRREGEQDYDRLQAEHGGDDDDNYYLRAPHHHGHHGTQVEFVPMS